MIGTTAELNGKSIAELKKERIAALNEEGAVVICTTAELNEKTRSVDANHMKGAHVKVCTALLRGQVPYGGTGTLCSRQNSKRKAKKKEQARQRHLAEVAEDAAQSHIRSIAAQLRIVGEYEEEKADKAFRESQVQAENAQQETRKKAQVARNKAWQESPSVARRYEKRLKQWALKYLKYPLEKTSTHAIQTLLQALRRETDSRW